MQILLQVLQWMEDAGIHPSNEMYREISSFSQKNCGAENAAVIKERLGMDTLFSFCFAFRILLHCVHICVLSFF